MGQTELPHPAGGVGQAVGHARRLPISVCVVCGSISTVCRPMSITLALTIVLYQSVCIFLFISQICLPGPCLYLSLHHLPFFVSICLSLARLLLCLLIYHPCYVSVCLSIYRHAYPALPLYISIYLSTLLSPPVYCSTNLSLFSLPVCALHHVCLSLSKALRV